MAVEITVPDIGDFTDVPVIEIHVKSGDAIKADDPLITLESDKATMDVPASQDGTVDKLLVKIGDQVSQGAPILLLNTNDAEAAQNPPPSQIEQQEPAPQQKTPPAAPAAPAAFPAASASAVSAPPAAPPTMATMPGAVHASPSVRRLARELEVDLKRITGTGEKGRITREDVKAFLRGPAQAAPAAGGAPSGGMGIPEIPAQDFSKFGPV